MAATKKDFERATILRNRLFHLRHIQDIALIQKSDIELPLIETNALSGIDLLGRIEAYDISNISGTSAVGVMTVFEEGRPVKSQYRKFKIKTVQGTDDYAMMEEVIRRRVKRGLQYPNAWPFPELMVIDGGKGQVGRVQVVLDELGVKIPIIGLAKGYDRKQDRLVFDRTNKDLLAVAERGKEIFQKVRDEAHRFAVSYHRVVRRASSGIPRKKSSN